MIRFSGITGLEGLPADEEIREAADDTDGERGPDQLRCPQRSEAEQGVERVDARAREGDANRAGGVEEGELDAVGSGEEAVLPVDAARGDDHDGEHERRTDGAEEAEGDEQPGGELAGGSGEGEESAGGEAELDEELARGVQAVAAEPAEELLGTVRRHDEAEDQSTDEKSGADHARVESVSRVHVVVSESPWAATPVREPAECRIAPW